VAKRGKDGKRRTGQDRRLSNNKRYLLRTDVKTPNYEGTQRFSSGKGKKVKTKKRKV